ARRTGWRERLVKWARRQPVVAGLLAAVVLVTVLGLAGITWEWADAVSVRHELDRTLYLETIALAERELFANNVTRAEELLDGPRCPGRLRGWEWHFLRRMSYPDTPTLRGYPSALFCVATSPDGRLLASGSGGPGVGEVKVWDAATGAEVRTLGRGPGQHTSW